MLDINEGYMGLEQYKFLSITIFRLLIIGRSKDFRFEFVENDEKSLGLSVVWVFILKN